MSLSTKYIDLQEDLEKKDSRQQNTAISTDRLTKGSQSTCGVKIVDGITQEIDCHCHTYQFWFGIFLLLYVVNFVSAIFIISNFATEDTFIAPQWLYIIYAIMGLMIVIVYILMEIETWGIHNGTLYVFSGLLAFLNIVSIKALINADNSAKQVILGVIALGSCLFEFWIVPKLRYRARNLIHLEQKRRRVRAEYSMQ